MYPFARRSEAGAAADRMESGLFAQKTGDKRKGDMVAYLAAALLLGGASFWVMLSQMRLSYSLSTAFSGGPVSGLVTAWNRLADTLGNTDFVLLQKYAGEGTEYGLFLTLTLLVFLGAAYAAVRSRFLPVLFLFAVPQILFGMIYGLHAGTLPVVALALAILFAAMIMKMDGGLSSGLGVTVALAVLALLLVQVADVEEVLPGTAQGRGVMTALEDRYYGRDDLGHGDLTQRERVTSEKTALKVTMETPDSLYLKGFIGSQFDGRRWSDLPAATYYAAEEDMRSLREEGFSGAGQVAQVADMTFDDVAETKISVENVGADSRQVFVPYEFAAMESPSQMDLKGNSHFFGGLHSRQKEYTYTAAGNQVKRWTDEAGRFFTMALGKAEDPERVENYLSQESWYNEFVYDNYTQVSAKDWEILLENIGEAGSQADGHLDYKVAIEAVRSYLEENFIYSEKLGEPVESHPNQMQEFFASHKGYDIHYATAATLMFRYYGIPARYVEGYLITPEDAETADTTIEVSHERAHAWTEIYVDGIGFVPIEVTPEFYGVMEEADLAVGISNSVLMREFQERYEDQSSGGAGEEEPEPPVVKKKTLSLLPLLGWTLLILLALALLAYLVRKLVLALLARREREKLFRQPDPKRAVAAIYGYMDGLSVQPSGEVVALGNRAAYSPKAITEEDRSTMLEAYRNMKKAAKSGGR